MNGVEAVKRIKSLSPATDIIMLTVVDSHEKIFKAICAGASGYLLKTSPAQNLVEAIREVHGGGAPMTPQVARSVLEMFSRLPSSQEDYKLTEREKEILELMVSGLIKKEIADKLDVSFHTVDTHLRKYLHQAACPHPHRSGRQSVEGTIVLTRDRRRKGHPRLRDRQGAGALLKTVVY